MFPFEPDKLNRETEITSGTRPGHWVLRFGSVLGTKIRETERWSPSPTSHWWHGLKRWFVSKKINMLIHMANMSCILSFNWDVRNWHHLCHKRCPEFMCIVRGYKLSYFRWSSARIYTENTSHCNPSRVPIAWKTSGCIWLHLCRLASVWCLQYPLGDSSRTNIFSLYAYMLKCTRATCVHIPYIFPFNQQNYMPRANSVYFPPKCGFNNLRTPRGPK